jgi:integrase
VDHDLVVAEPDGRPVDPDILTKWFTRLTRSLKIQGVHFHCLRHTAATTVLASGVHPKVVQECLGHSSVAITLDIYSHVAPTMQEDAARRMDSVLWAAVEGKGP